MENNVAISVIIPIYNTEKYLHNCLDSVANQTLKEIEIICIDDGSTDNSVDVIKVFQKTDPRIILLQQNNQGAGPARNSGIKKARGEYIAFMDSDDYYPNEGVLDSLYQAAIAHSAKICGGSLLFLLENNQLRPASANGKDYFFREEKFWEYRDLQQDFYYQRFIYKRSFIEKHALFFPDYARYQDVPFFVKTMLSAARFYAIPQNVYVYRIDEEGEKVLWTEKKACDVLRGMRDELYLTREGRLFQLHILTIQKRVRHFLENTIQPLFLSDCTQTMADLLFSLRDEIDLGHAQTSAAQDIETLDSILCSLVERKMLPKRELNSKEKAYRPKITVVVSIYNAKEYLAACLESVINQTLKDIEIICVDDGSSDGSANVIHDYSQRDPRMRVITFAENRSTLQTRKAGALAASGEYIMFLDADDELETNACKMLYGKIIVKNVDVLQFGVFVDAAPYAKASEVEWFKSFSAPFEQYLFGKGVFEGCFVEGKFSFNFWNKLFRSELCKRALSEVPDGYFHKAEDLYGVSLITWYAQSYYGIPDKLYHYYFGRGITGHAHALTLEELDCYCKQSQVAEQLKCFLEKYDAFQRYSSAWSNRRDMLIHECVVAWMNGVASENGAAGFDILCKYWGKEQISRILREKESSRCILAMEKASESKVLKELIDHGIPANSFLTLDIVSQDHALPPVGFTRVIPVVMAADDSYAAYASVTIESIRENAAERNYYHIYLLHTGLSEKRTAQMEALSTANMEVQCCCVDILLDQKKATLCTTAYFTQEMYYRFLIPELFWSFDKVVYLDCDTILLTDIAKMFPASLGDNLIAAVRDHLSKYRQEKLKDDFQLDPADYFNSGVIIVNCRQWLKEGTVGKCFDLLRTIQRDKLICPDQDILNVVCSERVYYLDPAWNYFWHLANSTVERKGVYQLTQNQIGENYNIIHYASEIKPWSSPEQPLAEYFWRYARKTRFYEEIVFRNTEKTIVTELEQRTADLQDESLREQLSTLQQQVEAVDKKVKIADEKLRVANQEIIDIHNSWTYRIGRFVTWIPRKIRGFNRCVKENGWNYTFHRIPEHFGIPMGIELAKKEPIYKGVAKKKHDPELIVSLTSFPARIKTVHKTIETILNQTEQPDRVILWLAKDQFPKRTRDLPKELLQLRRYGLEIRWCEDDLKPHKKYFWTMQDFPNAVIITIDDDVIYQNDLVEKLVYSYYTHPNAVSCMWGHTICMTGSDSFAPYTEWQKEKKLIGKPSYLTTPAGVGGVLYPPHIMQTEAFNKERIKDLCLYQDDLWLKWNLLKNKTPCIILKDYSNLVYIEGSQDTALWLSNVGQGINDKVWKTITQLDSGLTYDGQSIAQILFDSYETEFLADPQ